MKTTLLRAATLCWMVLFSSTLRAQGEDVWAASYVLEAEGKYGEAAALMEPLLKGEEGAELAHLRHGWLNYLMRNYNVAKRSYEGALKLNPRSVDARLGMSLSLLAQERWKEAALYSRQVLEQAPWNYTAHLRLLASEEGQGKWRTLRTHATELAAHYPADATAWVYLARAEIWLGNSAGARLAYRRVLRRSPGHLEAMAYMNKDGSKGR